MPIREIPFSDLATADLIVDAIYKGGSASNVSADPLQRLLPVGNSGGFRYKGRGSGLSIAKCSLIALFSTEDEPNWPDHLDVETGRFTYYGDNRHAGRQLHDTRKGGNRLLQQIFDALHSGNRAAIPPLFIFTTTGVGRDVHFRGLAAPGAPSLQAADDLVAVWKTNRGSRFQNYRATFTVLNVPSVNRQWINDILSGQPLLANTPPAWKGFVAKEAYDVLAAPRALAHRNPSQQKPTTPAGIRIIQTIHQHFEHRGTMGDDLVPASADRAAGCRPRSDKDDRCALRYSSWQVAGLRNGHAVAFR